MNQPSERSESAATSTRQSRLARIPRPLKWLIYCAYLAVLGVVGVELFWWLRFGSVPDTPERDAEFVWRYYYPELWDSGAMDAVTSPEDATIDILLLGGSVLEQTGPLWESAVSEQTGQKVRVYNLAVSAHTSRDSLTKYGHLKGKHFDWVVVYHGINDVQLNYATDEQFKDDYTHCAWYDGMQRRIKEGRLNLISLTDSLVTNLIDRGGPTPDRYHLGRKLRTPKPFGDNVRAIVDQALTSDARMMLMTFAWHLPSGYSREEYLAGRLDYGDGHFKMLAEDWGEPSQVPILIQAHNEEIRSAAVDASGQNAVLVDAASELAHTGKLFSDVCHLTPAGCEALVSMAVASFDERSSPLVIREPQESN